MMSVLSVYTGPCTPPQKRVHVYMYTGSRISLNTQAYFQIHNTRSEGFSRFVAICFFTPNPMYTYTLYTFGAAA